MTMNTYVIYGVNFKALKVVVIKSFLNIVADGGEDSRDKLPDILDVEKLRQLALEENVNNSRRQMLSISNPAPVNGKGISTVPVTAPWRIDRVDLPLSLEEAKNLKCQDLYRGIDSCEQDCSLVRTTIIDLHNFQSLFSKHWEWEDQRDCRSLTAPGMKSLNTDFAFCNTPCLNDPSIACTMCEFGYKEVKQNAVCESSKDTKHLAELYCATRNAQADCKFMNCRKVYGGPENVVSGYDVNGTASTTKEQSWDNSTSLEVGVKASLLGSGMETSTNIQVGVKGQYGMHIEGSGKPYVTRKLKDESGTIYDRVEGAPYSEYTCFAQVQKIDTKESNITANLGIEFSLNIVSFNGGTSVGVNKGNQEIVSHKTTSRKLRAGGLSPEYMMSECKRFQENWYKTTFLNLIAEDGELITALPSSWGDPKSWHLKNDGKKIKCRFGKGASKEDGLSTFSYEVLADKYLAVRYSRRKNGIFGVDRFARDPIYPQKNAYYKVPIDDYIYERLSRLMEKQLTNEELLELLNDHIAPYTLEKYSTMRNGKGDEGFLSGCTI